MDEVFFPDRSDWRAWLILNHARSRGIWLVFYRKKSGKSSMSYEGAVEEALCFGWIDSIIRKLDEERYVRKFTPRKRGSSWSESNRKRVSRLLSEESLMTKAGMTVINDAKESGSWSGSERPVIPDGIPAELQEALEENASAREFFESLTPSQRRRFSVWVAMAKREATRTARVRESIELLERGEKLGLR